MIRLFMRGNPKTYRNQNIVLALFVHDSKIRKKTGGCI